MKKIVSVLLAVVMLFSMSALAEKSDNILSFYSDWAKENIEKAQTLGLVEGSEDYTKPISRKDFCEIIYNYMNMVDKAILTNETNPFSDVDNEKVTALFSAEIVKGKSSDKFAPNDTLTREEAATILARTIEKTWGDAGITLQRVNFADVDEISDWAKQNVENIYKREIMKGVGASLEGLPIFSPKTTLTKEQAITTVVRLWERRPNEPESFADKLNDLMPENANYMFSPFSIKMALMMAANGAEGETQQEILDALGVSNIEEYNENTKKMLGTLSEFDILKLEVANSIWINSDNTPQRFSKKYSDKVKDVFGATSDIVNNENALSKVNGWVNEKTHGKIPEIIAEEQVKDFSAMLINAVYFKARWVNAFYAGATEPDIFTQRDGKTVEIDFMNQTEYMKCSIKNGVTIVRMPYRQYRENYDEDYNVIGVERVDGVNVNMYLMMSDYAFNAEKTLDQAAWKNTRIKLSVPKFKVEYSASLSDMLKEIGIVKAYDDKLAEFGPMVTFENMWIEDVLHKTYIEIDEKGTEAAAVTAIGVGGSGGIPPEPIEVKFNKPFTFVIRDDISGEILFMGEYAFAE